MTTPEIVVAVAVVWAIGLLFTWSLLSAAAAGDRHRPPIDDTYTIGDDDEAFDPPGSDSGRPAA